MSTPHGGASQSPVFVGNGGHPASQNLADILERVLDKGIVIVGDIQVRLLDIELLTIKLRLMVASVDRAREMGIDWWEGDPFVSTAARERRSPQTLDANGQRELELERRLEALEQQVGGREVSHEPR